MTPIAPHVTAFFQKRLAVELRASRNTCDTYAYAFQLLFEFMSRRLGVAPADLALEALDAPDEPPPPHPITARPDLPTLRTPMSTPVDAVCSAYSRCREVAHLERYGRPFE